MAKMFGGSTSADDGCRGRFPLLPSILLSIQSTLSGNQQPNIEDCAELGKRAIMSKQDQGDYWSLASSVEQFTTQGMLEPDR